MANTVLGKPLTVRVRHRPPPPQRTRCWKMTCPDPLLLPPAFCLHAPAAGRHLPLQPGQGAGPRPVWHHPRRRVQVVGQRLRLQVHRQAQAHVRGVCVCVCKQQILEGSAVAAAALPPAAVQAACRRSWLMAALSVTAPRRSALPGGAGCRCKEDIEDVRREVQIMHHLKGHANITYLKDAFEDRQAVHLVMDLCSGGELFDRIDAKGTYSEHDAAALIRDIVSVVAHCHNLGVIHRYAPGGEGAGGAEGGAGWRRLRGGAGRGAGAHSRCSCHPDESCACGCPPSALNPLAVLHPSPALAVAAAGT